MLKTLRQSAIHAANTPTFGSLLRLLNKVEVATPSSLSVVTYHRVDDAARTPHLHPGLISATPEHFRQQLDLLGETCEIVSMQQVLDAVRDRSELPDRSVLITFDDATTDFAEHAWPAMRDRKMPATVFVPTAYPDQPERRFWWDRLHMAVRHGKHDSIQTPLGQLDVSTDSARTTAFDKLRGYVKQLPHRDAMTLVENLSQQQDAAMPPASVLGWDQLRSLASEGVTLAAHTQTHPLLTQIPLDQARREIVESRKDLQREIGNALPVFAYPGGQCDEDIVQIMREEHFELAFTVQRGTNDVTSDELLKLKRINVGQKSSPQVLQAQLIAGWWRQRM